MVEFKNRRDVERWLADKPSEVAVVIAARAALRALPALVVVESEGARLLPVLRAAAVATLAAVDPDFAIKKAAATRAAALSVRVANETEKAAGGSAASLAARAAARAAYGADYAAGGDATATIDAAADTAEHASDAARACNAVGASLAHSEVAAAGIPYIHAYRAAALKGGAAAGSDAAKNMLDVIADDARIIEQYSLFRHSIARHPLWPKGLPLWAKVAWSTLSSSLTLREEDWDAWTDWYEARLQGGPANEALEVARVLIADEIWKQGPAVVNARIKTDRGVFVVAGDSRIGGEGRRTDETAGASARQAGATHCCDAFRL